MRSMLLSAAVFLCALSSYPDGLVFKDDYAYKYIETLAKSGMLDIDIGSLPVKESDVAKKIEQAAEKAVLSGREIDSSSRYLFRKLQNILNDGRAVHDRIEGIYSTVSEFNMRNSAEVRVSAGNFLFRSELATDYPYRDTMTALPWKNTASQMKNGYIGIVWEGGYAAAGRFLPAWGQGIFDNMFISGKIKHPDGFLFDIKKGFAGFSYYATVLSEYTYLERITHRKRFVNMHRVYADLPFKTGISFKEAVIYSSGAIEPYYLNPALFYYITQWNSDNDDNIVWSLELWSRAVRNLRFSAEYFIDDFQYNSEYDGYSPNKTAFVLSASYSPDFMIKTIIEAEYARAEKYTGTHEYSDMTYSYYDRPLYYFTGPDADLAGIRVKILPAAGLTVLAEAVRIRSGEGDIHISWESELPQTEPDFPSGIVETLYSANAGIEYELNDALSAKAGAGFSRFLNKENVQGENEDMFEMSIAIEVKI